MKLSDFNPTQNTSALIAGEAIAAKKLLAVDGFDGKAYGVDVSNFAAVGNVDYGTAQTNTATGRIVAQTSLVASVSAAEARQAVTVNSAGEIFCLHDDSLNNGLRLSKYQATGSLLGSVVIATTTKRYNHQILLLSNGNIGCVANSGAVGTTEFAIYDSNLNLVKGLTSVSPVAGHFFAACSLSGGGFAVVYHDSANDLLSILATYSNSGTVVQAATTIWTRTGTTGVQHHKIEQLSSGNLAVAVYSNNTVASIGLFYAVITTAGAIVSAFTSLDTTGAVDIYPELAVMTGYFAVSLPNGTNQKAYIFNNAGTAQGSAFSAATTAGTTLNKTKLVSDGAAFWLIWHRSSDSKCCMTKLPTTGTGYVTVITTTSTTQYDFYLDAFYENGLICAISMASAVNTAPTMWVLSTASGALVSTSETPFGAVPGTTNGQYPRVISGGDRAFIALYDYASAAGTFLCVGKYSRTAVIGVAQIAAAAAETVRMYSQAGAYETTFVGGSAAAFDHTTNVVVGNKGTILPYSVTLRGIGA